MKKRKDWTWRDHVRDYWPETTDEECSEILRDHTSWPFAGPGELLDELADYMHNVMHRSRLSEATDSALLFDPPPEMPDDGNGGAS